MGPEGQARHGKPCFQPPRENGHLKGDRDCRDEHLEEKMPPWEHHLERSPGRGRIGVHMPSSLPVPLLAPGASCTGFPQRNRVA